MAERVYAQYILDPDVTLASYAAMKFPGCSGTMIGPNVLLTAAHCGASASIKFRVYRSSTLMSTEIFNCSYLVRTRPDTDLLLEYCAPNAAGQNPGDKYGYLDLDIEVDHGRFNYSASRERADRSRAVYSIWWNPISNLGNVEAMLYSEGTVTSLTDAPHWYNPNRTDPCGPNADGRALGVEIDMWSNGGASGSSHLSRDRHRILHGPLSVGQSDGVGRGMLSIADYLFWGRVFSPFEVPCGISSSVPQLNAPFMESLGLDPENYTSWVDANLDGIFDVQKDLETLLGEAQRSRYWLGFESNRRDALWSQMGNVGFDLEDGTASIETLSAADTGFRGGIEHRQLHLKPNTYYLVSFYAFVRGAATSSPVRVKLAESSSVISLPVARSQRRVVRLFSGSAPNPVLAFQVAGQSDLSLSSVTVIEENARMDFDSHDERMTWRNDATGRRAFIWPNGNGPSTVPNWAGVVRATGTSTLWTLTNNNLGIRTGEVRVCFDHRVSDRLGFKLGAGVIRVQEQSGIGRGTTSFTPSGTWQRACSSWFNVSGTDNKLMFRATASASGAYLVDNVTVERR